jgi:hypothetical protein
MTMRRSHLATLLATLACIGAAGAQSAGAVEWTHHVGIGGGGNAFGPFVSLFVSETEGFGSGIGCAGIRGVAGVICESKAKERVALVLGGKVSSEPYIHNHSTFESFFNGWYSP